MKHLNKLFVSMLMIAGLSATAQDSDNPWAISFGANAVDTRTSASARDWNLRGHFSQPFNVKRNWNLLPSLSYLTVGRNVGGNFSVAVTGSVNKITKYAVYDDNGRRNYTIVNPDAMYYSADASLRYSLMKLIKSKKIDPNVNVGGGYTWMPDAFANQTKGGTLNFGGGLTYWFTENIGLNIGSNYKKSFGKRDGGGLASLFQHNAGFSFKFGGKDTDGDGIFDKDDTCPEAAGLKEFNGCPDSDNDGLQDSEDGCPKEAGTKELNGCPDSDGDGIADKDDACPSEKGLANLNGCPDADGDGIADAKDKCPTVAGPRDNGGCPWPDTDGDSVLDKDDKCVDVKGTVANNGCPEVTEDVVKSLNDYAKTILFDTSKSTFQEQTYPVLQAMVAILKQYPSSKFALEGHTDSDGKDAANLALSENRAAAVKNYLVENGVDAGRLTSAGFGEAKPIASNKTKAGKAQNRRVEVKLAQ